MKIIDLLNKIVNDEEIPNKIKYCRTIFYYDDNSRDYISISNEFNSGGISICKYIFGGNLNDEVEIIEEENKIPEKLKWNEKSQHNVVTDNTKKTLEHLLSRSEQLKKSINEIIDYLKSKGE